MTCATQMENCIKLQQQQKRLEQQPLEKCNSNISSNNNSNKFAKAKSLELLLSAAAQRITRTATSKKSLKPRLDATAAVSATTTTACSAQQEAANTFNVDDDAQDTMMRCTEAAVASSSEVAGSCCAAAQSASSPQLPPPLSSKQNRGISGGQTQLIAVCKLQTLILSIFILISTHLQNVSASNSMMSQHEPMFVSRSETFKFIAGETIDLPCQVKNTDPYVVAWKRGIAILTAGSVKVTPDPRVRLVKGFDLQIRDAVPQDAGDYICQIATMEPREITHTVEILVPPRIHHISTGGHLQVKKGSSVRIECSASGNPTPNVTWSRKNNILPNGEEKLHSHILSIENVDRHKGGVYICTANNGVGQAASSQVVLHVLYPPEISVERPVVFSGEGHEAMLVCIVHGETQPEVIWFKDTMQLDTTERHIMETRGSRHTLIIRKVHPQDFGNYSCVAENQLGKSRKTLELSGRPNLAIFNSPAISQYKDRYNISWTVDSYTPIEEYQLNFRRLPQGHEVDNSIDSHSSMSSLSSSSSLLKMYPMGSMGGSSHGSNNHRLSASLGLGGNGLDGYGNGIMHWGNRNEWRKMVLAAMPLSHHYTQGMSYMIRDLDPDQQYEAIVVSRNRYGWSDFERTFIFTTSSNDNEMRDLSVTFYGGNGATHKFQPSLLMLPSLLLALVKVSKMILSN